MLLKPGHWLGRGSLLVEGRSLGDTVAIDVRLERDEGGFTLTAVQTTGGAARDYSIRIAHNDVGTYTLAVRTQGETLSGTAKLDSAPNLGLLWNDSGTVHATFALFGVNDGCGCRGFVRTGATTYTWEIAFGLKQDVVRGSNVVSLTRRRR